MKKSQKADAFLLDANVIIDFIKVAPEIFQILTNKSEKLNILHNILFQEVDELNRDLISTFVNIIEPNIEDLLNSSSQGKGLSFYDWQCYHTAKRNNFFLLTNDKNLKKICEEGGVVSFWSLEFLLKIYKKALIDKAFAIKIAKDIHEINPKYINKEFLGKFMMELRKI